MPSQVPTAFSAAVSMLQTPWMAGAPVSMPASKAGATWVFDAANGHPWVYNPVALAWQGVAPTASPVFTGITNAAGLKSANASYQARPADPTGSTNTITGVMMGLAGSITPSGSGKVLVTVTGNLTNASSVGFGASVQARYGTGTAPSNGATPVGTSVSPGAVLKYTSASSSEIVPFTCCGVVTGLTVGTPYWIDLALAASGGGTATATNISVTAVEVP